MNSSSETPHIKSCPSRDFHGIIGTCLLTLLLSCGTFSPAWAGAWTPEPGHGYAKLWTKWLPGFFYQNGAGGSTDYGTYHELFVSAYAEWGLLDRLGLWLHAPLIRNFWLEDTRNNNVQHHITPGDPALGLRWNFIKFKGFRMSIEGGVRAPLAYRQPVQTVYAKAPPHPAIAELRIGRGVWEFQASLALGMAFSGFYTGAQINLLACTGGFDSILSWNAEVGWQPGQRWQLRIRINGAHPLGNGDASYHETPSGLGNGTRYIGFALEADYAFAPSWAVGISLEGGLFDVRRQTGGPVISPYLAKRF